MLTQKSFGRTERLGNISYFSSSPQPQSKTSSLSYVKQPRRHTPQLPTPTSTSNSARLFSSHNRTLPYISIFQPIGDEKTLTPEPFGSAEPNAQLSSAPCIRSTECQHQENPGQDGASNALARDYTRIVGTLLIGGIIGGRALGAWKRAGRATLSR